jgi:hypothetical protein
LRRRLLARVPSRFLAAQLKIMIELTFSWAQAAEISCRLINFNFGEVISKKSYFLSALILIKIHRDTLSLSLYIYTHLQADV